MMKWTPWIVGSLCLATLAACEGNRRDNSDTGAAGAGTESGAIQAGAATDTSLSSPGAVGDTAGAQPGTGAPEGQSADTARTSGRSESDTTSSSREPVTAKGDTLRGGSDSTTVGQQ